MSKTLNGKEKRQLRVQRLVRPFEVGQSVDYRNHVVGYSISPLVITDISENRVAAKSDGGRTFHFAADTGVAAWSCNLSITHWPNDRTELSARVTPVAHDNQKI